MERFKSKIMDSMKEMQENSGETIDLGVEMQEQADHMNRVLDTIRLQDVEDRQLLKDVKGELQDNFNSAFTVQVEGAGEEVEHQGTQIHEAIAEERSNLRAGIESMDQARQISDIGYEALDTGRGKLEQSSDEYEEMSDQTEQVADDTAKRIEELRKRVDGIFG